MIVVNKIIPSGVVVTGIPLHNLTSFNVAENEDVWIKHWEAGEVRSMKVDHTAEELATKVFVARHGKLPAKGVVLV